MLPFGAVCIELFFIMSALWLHQIYYVVGFLVAVLLILTATCAEMAIVLAYFQLCNEDYRWGREPKNGSAIWNIAPGANLTSAEGS